jgi:flagellar hook assembly protein FlgD
VVNCQSRRNHVESTNGLTPARNVMGFTLKIAPNPMSTSTVITYTLAKDSKVNIVIYNYMMQPIKVLVNDNVTKGTYSITWDGSSSSGNFVSSGIYKIVALVNGQQYTTSLQVLR